MNSRFWKVEAGGHVWCPTEDGKFEEWMDANDPTWKSGSSGSIEFAREVWEASRAMYGVQD